MVMNISPKAMGCTLMILTFLSVLRFGLFDGGAGKREVFSFGPQAINRSSSLLVVEGAKKANCKSFICQSSANGVVFAEAALGGAGVVSVEEYGSFDGVLPEGLSDLDEFFIEQGEVDSTNDWAISFKSKVGHEFEGESIEYEWAMSQEQFYLDLFSSKPRLAEYALLDSRCKSNQCKVSVAVTDDVQAGGLLGELATSALEENTIVNIVVGASEQDGAAVFFVSAGEL